MQSGTGGGLNQQGGMEIAFLMGQSIKYVCQDELPRRATLCQRGAWQEAEGSETL